QAELHKETLSQNDDDDDDDGDDGGDDGDDDDDDGDDGGDDGDGMNSQGWNRDGSADLTSSICLLLSNVYS
ncbi:hypothetical protein STEG23_026258, partial [Scotinomys teguina]